jgi:hypothetical protein
LEYTIDFGGSPQDVTVTVAGVATARAFHLYNEELTSDPRFRAGMTILVDATGLDTSELLAGGQLETAARPLAERDWEYPPLAVAVIAPDPATFEAMRLGQAHLGGTGFRRRAFLTREDALAWLAEKRNGAA